jgi:hypothetical protein
MNDWRLKASPTLLPSARTRPATTQSYGRPATDDGQLATDNEQLRTDN